MGFSLLDIVEDCARTLVGNRSGDGMGSDFKKAGLKRPSIPNIPIIGDMAESCIDNVFRATVKSPAIGSVVYCDLWAVEHTGIYVGKGKIVHLDGSGDIREVSSSTFLDRLEGLNTAISIYTICDDENPVGDAQVAKRARKMVGQTRDYNPFTDNCHQFTAGCLTDDFNNGYNAFNLLKNLAEEELGGNTWRVWNN